MENNERFKLITRRYLAWGLAGIISLTISFICIWGAVTNVPEYVAGALGYFGGILSALSVFYFGKKLSEE